jgi:hypothetical protein
MRCYPFPGSLCRRCVSHHRSGVGPGQVKAMCAFPRAGGTYPRLVRTVSSESVESETMDDLNLCPRFRATTTTRLSAFLPRTVMYACACTCKAHRSELLAALGASSLAWLVRKIIMYSPGRLLMYDAILPPLAGGHLTKSGGVPRITENACNGSFFACLLILALSLFSSSLLLLLASSLLLFFSSSSLLLFFSSSLLLFFFSSSSLLLFFSSSSLARFFSSSLTRFFSSSFLLLVFFSSSLLLLFFSSSSPLLFFSSSLLLFFSSLFLVLFLASLVLSLFFFGAPRGLNRSDDDLAFALSLSFS